MKRIKGKLVRWHDDKGYGFLAPALGGNQIFIHISAFSNRKRRPQVDDVVSFAIAEDKQGRPCAAEAMIGADEVKDEVARKRNVSPIVYALGVLACAAVAVLIWSALLR